MLFKFKCFLVVTREPLQAVCCVFLRFLVLTRDFSWFHERPRDYAWFHENVMMIVQSVH